MMKFIVLVKKEIKEMITLQSLMITVLMVGIFAFMGKTISSQIEKSEAPQHINILDQDKSELSNQALDIFKKSNLSVNLSRDQTIQSALESSQKNKDIIALIVIPSGFSNNIKNFNTEKFQVYKIIRDFTSGNLKRSEIIDAAVKKVNDHFSDYWITESKMKYKPDIIKNPVGTEEVAVFEGRQAKISFATVISSFSSQMIVVPLILFLLIMNSITSVVGAVTSEKSNKTLETLLSLPVNRKTIIFAKLVGAGLSALLLTGIYMIGYSVFIGSIVSSPSQAVNNDQITNAMSTLGLVMRSGDFLLLGASIFIGIMTALALAILLGTIGGGGTTFIMMVLIMLPNFLIMTIDINNIPFVFRLLLYAIPFTHPLSAMQKLITHDYMFVVGGIIYQAVLFFILIVIVERIFTSDKILTLRLSFIKKKESY